MTLDDLLGVWALVDATARGSRVHTGQTHLVVQADRLWEVWPDSVYYEGEPGPEHTYSFDAGSPARLRVEVPRGAFCHLVVRDGDTLRKRLGGVFGSFPDSMDDEYGTLYVYERVRGVEADALLQPVPRRSRSQVLHPVLGELTFDANLDWWSTRMEISGAELRVDVSVDPSVDPAPAFDVAADIVRRVEPATLAAYAASQLLDLHNDTWRDDDDGPPIDAATFAARLTPTSLTIELDGEGATLWFDDGDLFWGHIVHVGLDAQLQPVDASFSG